MDVYTYQYACQRWWGITTGKRNIYIENDLNPEQAARNDAKIVSGASECDVQLIQRFKMSVTDVETYPAMACQPMFRYQKSEK